MIASLPRPEDFDVDGDICVDVENEGFTEEEMEALTPAVAAVGSRGLSARGLWPRNRTVPPELRELKSEFGYQSRPLLTNLVDVANAQGTPLSGGIKARLGKDNFYILQCGVYIVPGGGERFEALKFEVRYNDEHVSTYSMLPGPQMDTKLKVGGKVEVGVNGSMGFAIPDIPLGSAAVSAEAKAKLESTFVYAFDYELKTPVVDSYGQNNPFCGWVLHEGASLRNDVLFYPIIIAPKSIDAFDCEFRAHFKIGHSGWTNSEFFLKPSRTIRVSA